MARRTRLACLITILAVTTAEQDLGRWSRQLSSYTSDMTDWVPLPGPVEREPLQVKRQAIAEPRILSEPVYQSFGRPAFNQDPFPSRAYFNSPANRQLYLQSVPAVPSAPQNFLSDQGFGQSIRFGLQQPNFPLSQGFVGPQFTFDSAPPPPQLKHRPAANPIKFDSFPKATLPLSPQAQPFVNQGPKKIEQPKFVDGYRADNVSNDFNNRKPQSLQKLKYESFEKMPKTEMIPPNKPKVEREEVQLLYVPLESLNRGQFNFRNPQQQQLQNSDPYSQNIQRPNTSNPPRQTFTDFQSPIAKPLDTFGTNHDYFNSYNQQYKELDQIPKFSTLPSTFQTSAPTTPRPKKLKPHQPPLAIFLTQEAKKGAQLKVGDVLSSLKNAETIAVLDSVNPASSPKVFIGPSSLTPPENFVKFELPYLSNIEHTDKKLRQLPFFVAPLSYNTPQGFAKIPFPSPHVGSVVINSQIKDSAATLTTPIADVIPNSYSTSPQSYKQETRPATQKPNFSYFSTSPPKTNPPPNYHTNNFYSIEPQTVSTVRTPKDPYYSFEPQTVSTLRPPKEPQAITSSPKPGSYFLSNVNQYQPNQNLKPQNDYKTQEPLKAFSVAKPKETQNYRTQQHRVQDYRAQEHKTQDQRTQEPVRNYNFAKVTETPTTTVSSTTPKPSTYPSQLLETHNPYSINQAFHFSTPLDYHNFFEEGYVTPGLSQPGQNQPSSSPIPSSTPSPTPKPVEPVTERQKYQSSPNYLQNYSPEIHYESEQNSRHPVFNTNDYTTKSEPSSVYTQTSQENTENTHSFSSANPTEYNGNLETQAPVIENTETVNKASSEVESSTRSPYSYNQYETSREAEEKPPSSTTSTTTTTTTTTRRTPIRQRGRPRYTTTPKTESGESTTRTYATRRPLRERKPPVNRPRYEPNKITTEKATRKPIESGESTTSKYNRSRTRGRVQFKQNDSEDYYNKPNKGRGSKQDDDLAYQRDVLHQNYPVTLMERTSTVDIEAITEPSPKASTKDVESSTQYLDTENAYSNDRAAISQQFPSRNSQEDTNYTPRTETQTETSYVPRGSSTRKEQYTFQSRSSLAPVDAVSYDETETPDKEEDIYVRQTTPVQKLEQPEVISYATESSSAVTEQNLPSYSISNDFSSAKYEEVTAVPEIETTKAESIEEEPEENIVQTTPSYNRVRVRPGVIRQYHQASSTESSKTKTDRRRPIQAVTYRPAFERRRTTMRIEEIEADLKTKQVHARPESQEHRHPVYRPDPITEPTVTSQSTQETTTKRGVFRRRRPTYTTTSTESSGTKKSAYEVKNRFRGRRPTEKPTDKPEVQTDVSSTTIKNTLHSRYSNRPRLSERYNKKQEPEESSEDQDSNYSINRPRYVEPESDQWSPKISTDSFRPFNPNDIVDDVKVATTERRSDSEDEELDIITAKNEYDDILLTVTPATNNRANKKIPDIPPTLEALVEQSKVTKSDTGDNMSTFESMLEEVMKSLEEQDEHEYTTNVMKHEGGEIGEIPPERVITSGDNYSQKTTTVEQQDSTTIEPTAADDSAHNEDEADQTKGHRRGFWKKVKKVRPVTESIEAAESQYYSNTVNRLGHRITLAKTVHDKSAKHDKPKIAVTTYKPNFQFLQDIFNDDGSLDVIPTVDIPKLNKRIVEDKFESLKEIKETTESFLSRETPSEPNPGDMDLGTGTPDPTLADDFDYIPTTEESSKAEMAILDRTDGFSFMDYLFGNSQDEDNTETSKTETHSSTDSPKSTLKEDIDVSTEQLTTKAPTTESTYIPDEITASTQEDKTESVIPEFEIRKVNATENPTAVEAVVETTEKSVRVETSSVSSFMDPTNVMSTSMSTEISHETEICFRGKCIKTNKDLL